MSNRENAIVYLKANKPERKVSDCKSRRLEPQIMELIKKDWEVSLIAKKFKISHYLVKNVALNNNIDIDDRKLKKKIERNELIYKMLLEGKNYQEISDKMNVSKHIIYEVATTNNFSVWEESKKKHEAIIKKITHDINSGVSYEQVKNK